MIYNILNESIEFGSEDRTIIQDNLLILFIICYYDKDKFDILLNEEGQYQFDLKTLLIKGIYYKSPNLRQLFCHVFYLLGKLAIEEDVEKFNPTVMDILLKNIP
jgi:hypothetical protein